MKPAGNDIARDLRAEIKRLSEELQQARLRLNDLNGSVLPTFEDFDVALPQELSWKEIATLLSRQEQRVLCCYLECPNDKAVARRTGKKLQTVRNQMASIERKLNARGRGEVIIQVLTAYFAKKLRNG